MSRHWTSHHVVQLALLLFTILAACTDADANSPFKRRGWLTSNRRRSVDLTNAYSAVNFPRGGNANANDGSDETKQLVIIVDVDNTLYSEQTLLSSTGDGIESQIVRNTHLFGLLHFNLTSDQCDELYKKYGSTIEGLRHTLPPDQVQETMARFYQEVYDTIDFSCLLGVSKKGGTHLGDNARSGYDHGNALQKRQALAEFLKSICQTHTVYLASNSPKAHIDRVINSMGLGSVDFAGVVSPDVDASGLRRSDNQEEIYPTKSSPRQYYKHILDQHPPSSNRIILLDDSLHNLREAESVCIEGIHIHQSGRTFEEGLAEALGHILPSDPANTVSSSERYTFSDVEYLIAKNKVDINAINPSVWEELAQELVLRIEQKANGELRIADLGAGMLSMLELVLTGGGQDDRVKPSMLALINKFQKSSQKSNTHSIAKLEYFAYESNLNLLKGCKERLHSMGFQEIESSSPEDGVSLFRRGTSDNDMEIIVHLRPVDFQGDQSPPKGLDLIIGCCFADLFDPGQLVLSLQRFALGGSHPLVYFPITFAGMTQFSQAYPALPSQSLCNHIIPSDTTAFRMYSESLAHHGHNLDPSLIENAINDHGGSLISKAKSDWIIDPSLNPHLWETMLYFFGMSGARHLSKHHLNGAGWIKRCREDPRTIVVSNVDLLFHLQADPSVHAEGAASIGSTENDTSQTVSVQEIQFFAPYKVTTVTKQWDTSGSGHLSPDQVEIESVCSLISSGTELTIFKGSFQSTQLDVNIEGMADELMEYPLAYGYCLIGRVVACGSNVGDAESLIGRLVFTFSPHSSRVITDRDAIQLVPKDINAEDAVFMPMVETALSMVHDAHIRLGENVAVYGQGLVGLLVTSILSLQSLSLFSPSESFSSVTSFDTLDDRLSLSSSLGATSALKPNAAASAGPFDVSIEVSGNPRGLQSAIDNTSNNGRIIVGSWYGDTDVALKLGIDFHRSHKTIITSQVSTIPPTLAGLWSKERRFLFTWALVKSLRPSRLITKRLTLDEVQQAYELLDRGQEIAICFKYD